MSGKHSDEIKLQGHSAWWATLERLVKEGLLEEALGCAEQEQRPWGTLVVLALIT